MKTWLRARALLLVAVPCVLVLMWSVYFSGLQGPFIFDDLVNILRPSEIALRHLAGAEVRDALFAKGLWYPQRGLARLSFALNFYLAGAQFNVLAFKVTNLLIHSLNTLLVWFLAHRLLARYAGSRNIQEYILGRPWWHWAALSGALIWALHPLQLTAVLYVVQRMTSLGALFTLLGLSLWLIGRECLPQTPKRALLLMYGGVVFGVLLGMLSKENAILLPFYALLIELIFFRRDDLQPSTVRNIRYFFLLVAVLPTLLAFLYIGSHIDYFLSDYHSRTFTPVERLLTESRVLWYYLQLLFFPSLHNFGIFHDDFALSKGLLVPPSTLVALLAWAGILALASMGLYKRWLFSFAVFWYLIGHSIESSFIALELVFEHRNYLPIAGITVVFSVFLLRSLMALSTKPVLRLGLPAILVMVLSGITFARANIWQYQYTIVYIGVKNHPASSRYHREYGDQLSRNGGSEAEIFNQMQISARLDSGEVSVLFEMGRIIARRLIRAGFASGPVAQDRPSVNLLQDPLPGDVPTLRSFEMAIDKEVRRRARHEVLATNSVEIAIYTRSCLNTVNPVCTRMLDYVSVWIKLLAENRYSSNLSRALSALAYAKIMSAQGNFSDAIASMSTAVQLMPNAADFRIQQAQMFLSLKRLNDADKVMAQARKLLPWHGAGNAYFDRVRKSIHEARMMKSKP